MPHTFYNRHADILAAQYLSKSFEEVHHAWLHVLDPLLEKRNINVLDIGAGAGRDSAYLAKQGKNNGLHVTAVEPAKLLASIGQQQTLGLSVDWLEDSLPLLNVVSQQDRRYDLILLSAVWMHVPEAERAQALVQLVNLLKPGGKLVITLRHGASNDERVMHQVCANELAQLAKDIDLFTVLVTEKDVDKLGRAEIYWQTVILQLAVG
ncbi:class I SAM-dependent methyltransferase [Alteromonadales bacterium alter-6D02]|nr:class I SAM-dependent methyltransferase [Alteromonadales bacterium alter-6D02]